MRRLPGPHQNLKKMYREVNKFTAEKIEEHKKNLDPSDPRDYIDCFLIEVEKVSRSPHVTVLQRVHPLMLAAITDVTLHSLSRTEPQIPFMFCPTQNKAEPNSSFYEENLVWCVLDLFAAGSETTSTTLRWALLYMSKYPEIQGRRATGQVSLPTM